MRCSRAASVTCARSPASLATRIEASAGGGVDDLAPQLQVLRPQVADRQAHVMAIEAVQRLLDHRVLRPGHARHPRLGAGAGDGLEVPAKDKILPGLPRPALIGESDVVELSRGQIPLHRIDRRVLCSHPGALRDGAPPTHKPHERRN